MEFFQYEAARTENPVPRSEVSLDATLREEGSFSDSGDRKSGLISR